MFRRIDRHSNPRGRLKFRRQLWCAPELGPCLRVRTLEKSLSEIDMRTFMAGTTKIDVIAHISQEGLELDRLVLSRFEGCETTANAALQTLVDRYGGRPLAEYASAPQEIELTDLSGEATLQQTPTIRH
jgi:hypothetical protein